MGWNDREPYFSMIESRMDDGMDFDEAMNDVINLMRDAADQRRKEES